MFFPTATGYTLQTLAMLPEDGSYDLARSMAQQLNLPGPCLAKILQNLVAAGILESVRGPKGGFRMARSAQAVTVGDWWRRWREAAAWRAVSWVSRTAVQRTPVPCMPPGAEWGPRWALP